MDESADARRILTAVPQSDWKRPAGRPHTSWMATIKNDLSFHGFTTSVWKIPRQATLEVIDSKRSYALNWCKPNNDDDDDDDDDDISNNYTDTQGSRIIP